MVNMVRGYVDHEAVHIRETDFGLIRSSKLSPVERHVWNIIEDHRIERVFGERYPGCQVNFEWLVLRFFDIETPPATPELMVLNWLLTVVRSWSAPRKEPRTIPLTEAMVRDFPGLKAKLSAAIAEVKADCPDTRETIKFARRIVGVIGDHLDSKEVSDIRSDGQDGGGEREALDQKTQDGSDPVGLRGFGEDGKPMGAYGVKYGGAGRNTTLKSLLAKGESELPRSLESMMESRLEVIRTSRMGANSFLGSQDVEKIGPYKRRPAKKENRETWV
jgi:hypothetical protein